MLLFHHGCYRWFVLEKAIALPKKPARESYALMNLVQGRNTSHLENAARFAGLMSQQQLLQVSMMKNLLPTRDLG